MKRIHLYRGKRLDNGQFIEGSLIGEDVIVGKIVDFEEDYFTTEFWYKVVPETVGQFTGMTDKNGTKIFEGDIIKWIDSDGNNRIDKVLFSNGGFHLCNIYYNIGGYKGNSLEVIGNIHDNKELLK